MQTAIKSFGAALQYFKYDAYSMIFKSVILFMISNVTKSVSVFNDNINLHEVLVFYDIDSIYLSYIHKL